MQNKFCYNNGFSSMVKNIYLLRNYSFHLKIKSSTQELILFISPIAHRSRIRLALFQTSKSEII